MKKYELRKLKRNIYKYGNAISYGVIFLIATVITILAATGRTDDVAYVDESQLITSVNSVDIKESEKQKVAANETTEATTAETIEDDATTESVTSDNTTSEPEVSSGVATSKIRITADSLNVRKLPSTDAEPMGEVVMDEVYEVVAYEGQWVKIKFGNEIGYINAAYVQVAE